MATTYTIFADNGDETITALGQEDGNSPQAALRSFIRNQDATANEPDAKPAKFDGDFIVIPTGNLHHVNVQIETRTQLTIT